MLLPAKNQLTGNVTEGQFKSSFDQIMDFLYFIQRQGWVFGTTSELLESAPLEGKYALALDTGNTWIYETRDKVRAWHNSKKSDLELTKDLITKNKELILKLYTMLSSHSNAINNAIELTSKVELENSKQDNVLKNMLLAIHGHSQVLSSHFDNESEDKKLENLMIIEQLAQELNQLDGFDPTKTATASSSATYDNFHIFPEPRSIVVINAYMAKIPNRKADGKELGSVHVSIDGQVLDCKCTFAVQGSSSEFHPKKSLTLAFFSDAKYTKKINLKIGAVQPHDEWRFKNNYIDKTQTRNIVTYQIWDQVQEFRKDYPIKDIDNFYVGKKGLDGVNTEANGHPWGYVCAMYINDQFYGLGALMTGKKRENYNLDVKDLDHVGISFAQPDEDVTGFIDMTKLEPGTYELRSPKKMTPETQKHIDAFTAVSSLEQAEFDVKIRDVFDTRNVVDFYLFTNMIGNWDSLVNNTMMNTWDGKRWYLFPYDLDQSMWNWGVSSGDVMLTNALNKPFWQKVFNAYRSELQVRWAELRDSGIYDLPNFLRLFKNISDLIPKNLIQAELEKWPFDIGGQDEYMQWFMRRLSNLDVIFKYKQ